MANVTVESTIVRNKINNSDSVVSHIIGGVRGFARAFHRLGNTVDVTAQVAEECAYSSCEWATEGGFRKLIE